MKLTPTNLSWSDIELYSLPFQFGSDSVQSNISAKRKCRYRLTLQLPNSYRMLWPLENMYRRRWDFFSYDCSFCKGKDLIKFSAWFIQKNVTWKKIFHKELNVFFRYSQFFFTQFYFDTNNWRHEVKGCT